MAVRGNSAKERGDALYAFRVNKLRAFSSERFPSPARADSKARARVRAAYDAIFGRGDKHKPLISTHSTVVHFVANKKQEAAARKAARAYNATLPPDATVSHLFQRGTPEQIRKMKRDIGQDTPGTVRSIIIKQDKVPGETNLWTSGEVIKLDDRYIRINGDQVKVFRPIDPGRWIDDPEAEEARVMVRLKRDAERIREHFRLKRGFEIGTDTRFSPQVGNHEYIGGEAYEDQVHDLLRSWSARYGMDTKVKADQAPVAEWLTGINLVVFINRTGKKQYDSEWEAQRVRRLKKGQMRRRVRRAQQARSTRRTSTPLRPRKRR